MASKDEFLYAEDFLKNQEFVDAYVTIEDYFPPNTLRRADRKMVDKPCISFKGSNKKLVLCKTNVSVLHIVTGFAEGKDWIGYKIHLAARVVDAWGAETLAIRVIPAAGTVLRKKIIEMLGRAAVWEGERRLKEMTMKPEEE